MKNLDFILRLKAYEVFLIIVAGGILKEVELDNLLFTAILNAIGMVVAGSWILFVGHRLYHYFPGIKNMNYMVFTFCSIIMGFSMIIGQMGSVLWHETMLDLFTIPGSVFIFFCSVYCLLFTSKLIHSVASAREVGSFDNFGILILILILPIGIWFLQPMVNKAVANKPLEQAV